MHYDNNQIETVQNWGLQFVHYTINFPADMEKDTQSLKLTPALSRTLPQTQSSNAGRLQAGLQPIKAWPFSLIQSALKYSRFCRIVLRFAVHLYTCLCGYVPPLVSNWTSDTRFDNDNVDAEVAAEAEVKFRTNLTTT